MPDRRVPVVGSIRFRTGPPHVLVPRIRILPDFDAGENSSLREPYRVREPSVAYASLEDIQFQSDLAVEKKATCSRQNRKLFLFCAVDDNDNTTCFQPNSTL